MQLPERREPLWFGDLDQALHFLWTAKFSLDDLVEAAESEARPVLHDARASVTRAIDTLGSLLGSADSPEPSGELG